MITLVLAIEKSPNKMAPMMHDYARLSFYIFETSIAMLRKTFVVRRQA